VTGARIVVFSISAQAVKNIFLKMQCQRRTDVSFGNPVISQLNKAKVDQALHAQIKHAKPGIDCTVPYTYNTLRSGGKDQLYKKRKSFLNTPFIDQVKRLSMLMKTSRWLETLRTQ
jgi:hypothetical protein